MLSHSYLLFCWIVIGSVPEFDNANSRWEKERKDKEILKWDGLDGKNE